MNIWVSDILGQVKQTYDLGSVSGEITHEIDLSGMAKGIYFLHIKQGSEQEVRKLVLE